MVRFLVLCVFNYHLSFCCSETCDGQLEELGSLKYESDKRSLKHVVHSFPLVGPFTIAFRHQLQGSVGVPMLPVLNLHHQSDGPMKLLKPYE